MWLITHLPLFHFFIFLLDEKVGKEEQSCRRRTSAKEEALGWGGMHCRCRLLYLYNCTSWFMGFAGLLCVSFAAALGISGTSFPHDQYSEIHI